MNELNSISTPSPVQESSSELSSGLPDFTQLGLSQPILRAVQEQGYTHPTPIQAQAIPHVLTGKDVMGAAQRPAGGRIRGRKEANTVDLAERPTTETIGVLG